MKQRRFATSIALVTVSGLLLTGCTGGSGGGELTDLSSDYGFNAEGLPIVTEPLSLTFGGTKSALAPDYASMELVQQWAEDTNITIDWRNLPEQVYAEKKNLMLAGDELPDVLFNSGLSDSEIVQNGSNGTLIPLEDLIAAHAPTLSGILDARPDIRAALTASDGHIYTLPSVEELGILQYPNFLYINKQWLDTLGLPMPTTIDEYQAALEAFKTRDPNGNGKADEVPLSFRTDSFAANPSDLITALGGQPENNDHRIVRDGTVEFTANTSEYRAGVEALGEWYADGLIDPESFSQDDVAYLSKGKAETPILGSFFWWELEEMVGEDKSGDYELVGVLEGTNGERLASVSNNQEINRGAMALTRANQYPSATIRWADRLFDPVMSAQTSWGPIGVTLEEDAAGLLVQIPAPEGESEGERRQKVAPGGPKITTAEDFETVVAPEPRAKLRQDLVNENYAPYAANEAYPPVLLSNEELDQTAFALTDINSLVKEKFASWVVNGNIDAEWESYTSQLEGLGVAEVTDIYQQAYDRFQQGGE
ncbi:sugar ABC transporter substrate-binding protein [Pseudoclavibacter sp. RFBJ3]|uniref:ABC transporter substrate-binding protein n=1 Tax=unclassified Pseudoclavibacter TaxID=2615177 RepID=UPI000CE7FBA7|nr:MULTISPECIES: ABC transporter substrate-binding protein [unclassified Pseudoclavibacter]PPF83704.1 sugar ABC transporter substrate-binding protein [Pseudoclavibacter sp. RFBJ5]PPF91984.1 sugar ABC transporter substrate-binding protein [Pseudoclavibacter sp. RFBJ3]PPF96847.1 sugar ABC transporter substrate-binding protein [Pseudoclavibacter sp. RFBH5]PPG23533.1 sugar ABC transporter substrate-binding protein [Pseudoclavibacter sp. RFBI4]